MSDKPTIFDEVHHWTPDQAAALARIWGDMAAIRAAVLRGREQIARGESVTMAELRAEFGGTAPEHSAARSARGSEPEDA